MGMVDRDHLVAFFLKVKLAKQRLCVYDIVVDWIWCYVPTAHQFKRPIAAATQNPTDLLWLSLSRVNHNFPENGLCPRNGASGHLFSQPKNAAVCRVFNRTGFALFPDLKPKR
jgi:hypothetical protein